ncbi:hypothetical protein L226DRAFT_515393 [Lentinus tigrinus ALCF2SS1-7]|uniref:RING-type domain-containing protein n=1 Tax=Lentinus tigrinus ALCF2SS1-6 TaxID=1328759 RepID=A0A5C2RTM2_9APHY|nr:hypothetical protein L227DRAFT_555440 [Lentinus tigrinus ALCF2SS1-6]RPD69707.1 hypothetical protein L226DRAFT_515393 [Lentinus tigrinus ALCF2SS1-7]
MSQAGTNAPAMAHTPSSSLTAPTTLRRSRRQRDKSSKALHALPTSRPHTQSSRNVSEHSDHSDKHGSASLTESSTRSRQSGVAREESGGGASASCKRERSKSPVAGEIGRSKRRRDRNACVAHTRGSNALATTSTSAERSAAPLGGPESYTIPPPTESERGTGSSTRATLHPHTPNTSSYNPTERTRRIADERLPGSSATSHTADEACHDVDTEFAPDEVYATSSFPSSPALPLKDLASAAGCGRASSSPSSHGDDILPRLSPGSSPKGLEPVFDNVPIQEGEPLAAYNCPVCFSPPSYATITPCGHVLCGDCLFTAVKTTMKRGAYTLPPGERMMPACPVCRAPIPGWDGKGGGVIGLRPRAVFSL